jgi:hypothetical protein
MIRPASRLLATTALVAATAVVTIPSTAGAADRAGDQRIADDSVLTIDDVPDGFKVSPDSDGPPPAGAECKAIRKGRAALSAVPNAEGNFLNTPPNGSGSERISSKVSVFGKTKAAKAAFAGYAGDDSEACFERTYEELLLDELDIPDATVDVTVDRYEPDLGDDAVGYELEIALAAQGDSQTLFYDIEVTRVGRAVAGFAFLDTGEPFPSDEIVDMTDTSVERLEDALG